GRDSPCRFILAGMRPARSSRERPGIDSSRPGVIGTHGPKASLNMPSLTAALTNPQLPISEVLPFASVAVRLSTEFAALAGTVTGLLKAAPVAPAAIVTFVLPR